jgi:NADPH-dependent glutamate synthase beta subunit-like oxidoreductase
MLLQTVNHLVRIAGIDVRYNTTIGEGKISLDKLKRDGFQAVFVAKGTPLPRVLTFQGAVLPHQDLSGVMFGLDFLYELSHGNLSPDYFQDKKVLVIGGGNVAFDVARSARRMGGMTTVIALENEDKTSKDGIPADEAEITGAWEEGIKLIYSRGVSQIIGSGGKFKGIESPKCTSVFDEGNGFNPQFDLTDTITIDGDIIIITVGQGPDSSFFKSENLVDENGRLAINPVSLQNGHKDWVFIGGDNRQPGYMADAMRDGLEAAESIERYFLGSDIERGRVKYYEPLLTPQRRHYQESPETVWIQPEKRMHFKVFEQGFELEEAIEEAKRCLKCGPCASCKACVSIGLQSHLPHIEVDAGMCCGCGICVTACGFGAIYLTDLSGVLSSQTDILKCKTCGMCMSACPSNARLLIGSGINRRVDEVIAQL